MILCRRLVAGYLSSGGPLLATGVVVLLGCSSPSAPGGPPAFGTVALLTAAGQSGALTVEVRTSPQPPPRGTVAVEFTVTNASGAPMDGLSLDIRPWMPAHAHGTSVVPTVTREGQGKYVLTNVDLFMPGHWELQTRFSGPVTDYAAPAFDVP
jgi:hypothetical protein